MLNIPAKVLVSEKLGTVSTLLTEAAKSTYLMVLGHGAGAGMHHPFMETLAQALSSETISTLRYQFPYMEQGRRRPDYPSIAHLTIARVLESIPQDIGIPVILAGKSFGGRMASQYIVKQQNHAVSALVFYGFPLHSPAKPGTDRADHLKEIDIPMLFLQGDRDALARIDLLSPLLLSHPNATLEILQGGDHSFKFLKKSGVTQEEGILRLADHTRSFLDGIF
ncbi:MAG: alpha/beta fold hydrolase [Saprospiraceae bacterium]|nr:alpha/beta fold hydrolase [Saprospiraceae bacterium]